MATNDDEDAVIAAGVTRIVREADDAFQRAGGGSRHWVRECFLPTLKHYGWDVAVPRCHACGEVLMREDEAWIDPETHSDCPRGGQHQPAVTRATPTQEP
jgi:hypothetical protein